MSRNKTYSVLQACIIMPSCTWLLIYFHTWLTTTCGYFVFSLLRSAGKGAWQLLYPVSDLLLINMPSRGLRQYNASLHLALLKPQVNSHINSESRRNHNNKYTQTHKTGRFVEDLLLDIHPPYKSRRKQYKDYIQHCT